MTSSLLLCDLAARDLVATNTSIFRTGSSSTAKRIGKEATPLNPTAHRELNRTEPNNPQARYIELTHTHTTYSRRRTTTNNNRVCFSSWLFLLLQQNRLFFFFFIRGRVTHCLHKANRERKKKTSFLPSWYLFSSFYFLWIVDSSFHFFSPFEWKIWNRKKNHLDFSVAPNCLLVLLVYKKRQIENCLRVFEKGRGKWKETEGEKNPINVPVVTSRRFKEKT